LEYPDEKAATLVVRIAAAGAAIELVFLAGEVLRDRCLVRRAQAQRA
jgi:hypothetical protein